MLGKITAKKTKEKIDGNTLLIYKKIQYQAFFEIYISKFNNTISIKKILEWNKKLENYTEKINTHNEIYSELKKKICTALLASKSLMNPEIENTKKLFNDEIIMIDPKLLKINPYHKDYFSEGGMNREKRKQLIVSIKDYGIKTPLQITKDFTLIAGHRRTGIALELRMEEVPCQVALYDLTDDELKLHLLEDFYLSRDVGSKQRKKIYSDIIGLVRKKIPNFDFLIRENKSGLDSELEDMGFSTKTREKILVQERRKASRDDNYRRVGLIQADYDSMQKNINRLVSVYIDTNEDTKLRIKPVILQKLKEAGLIK
jgi:tRNA(Ser,Leu) C12 N-acetylase TAN1